MVHSLENWTKKLINRDLCINNLEIYTHIQSNNHIRLHLKRQIQPFGKGMRMAHTPHERTAAVGIDPELAQHWVQASRSLAQLRGHMDSSPLREIWEPLLGFTQALDERRARGSDLDVTTLARAAVVRKTARCAESNDALRSLEAQEKMKSFSAQTVLSRAHLEQVQLLLGEQSKAWTELAITADLDLWLQDWHKAAAPQARPDALLQWPSLHARWLDLWPAYSGHQRLGWLLDMLLLQRAGLVSGMGLLWSRSAMAFEPQLDGQSVTSLHSCEEPLALQITLLDAMHLAASQTLAMLNALGALWTEVCHAVQAQHRFYSIELIRHLFLHPASRVDLLARDMVVTRLTATRYLDALVDTGVLQRERYGRDNIYAHGALLAVLKSPDRNCGLK